MNQTFLAIQIAFFYKCNLYFPSALGVQDKMRLESINELIQTEKAYIEDMIIVNRVFEKPLRESRVVPEKDVEEIFVNWEHILKCNKAFLSDLLDRQNSGTDIYGDIICSHVSNSEIVLVNF